MNFKLLTFFKCCFLHKKGLCVPFLLWGYLCLYGSWVFAAPPKVPAAGIVERQLELEYESSILQPERKIPLIQLDIPEEKLDLPEGVKIRVEKIDILNNATIAEKEIYSIAQPFLGKELTMKQIYHLCSLIEKLYGSYGYFLSRVYPPPQEVKDGVLKLEVLEGCIGDISVIGNKYYSKTFICSYFTPLLNKPLKRSVFLQALMLLNENSDLEVNAIFEKGKNFGCADVVLSVKDAKPMHLYVNANNYGRDLTTDIRAGGRFDWGNILFQGDMISLAEVVGFPFNALYFTDARYRVPLNRVGTYLQLNYLFSKFKVEEMTSLKMTGRSNIATIEVDQAIFRSQAWNADLFASFDYKQIQSFSKDHLTSFDKLRVWTLGFCIDHVNLGFSRDHLNVSFTGGIPDFLGALHAVDPICSRTGGGGKFFVFNADYDRIQFLPRDCFLYIHASGQVSPSKLTVPEQLYIGGYGTVRGFPFAVVTGDSGYFANLEFRTPPPYIGDKKFFWFKKTWKDVFQFDAFLDQGWALLQSEGNTFLWGTGVGFRLNQLWGLDFSFDVGFPLNQARLAKGVFYYMKLAGMAF